MGAHLHSVANDFRKVLQGFLHLEQSQFRTQGLLSALSIWGQKKKPIIEIGSTLLLEMLVLTRQKD